MEKLINRILLLCSIVGVSFGAYAFLEERPTKVLDKTTADLEQKIESEKAAVISYVNLKGEASSKELQNLNSNLNEKFSLLMKSIEKLDDRVYDLQRAQSADSRVIEADHDGG